MLNDDADDYDDADADDDDDDADDCCSILADVASDRSGLCSADSARHSLVNLRQDQVCKYDGDDGDDDDEDDEGDGDGDGDGVSNTHASR